MSIRVRSIGLVCLLLLPLASCTLRENEHYKVTTGRGAYLHLFGVPSWGLSHDLYVKTCKRSIVCTADLLNDKVKVSGWGAAEFHDGIRRYASFRSAIDASLKAGYSSGWSSGAKCLVLHKSISGSLSWSTEWIQPIDYNDDCWTGN